jgi:hypothetical protein
LERLGVDNRPLGTPKLRILTIRPYIHWVAGRRALEGLKSTVVVPARPGSIVPLASLERGRSDIDEALDDLFGEPDERGPGLADAVLLVGGVVAASTGLIAGSPFLVVVGAGAVALGLILPLRSLWRRVVSLRHTAALHRMIGDGALLRVGNPAIDRLVGAHSQVVAIGSLDEHDRARAATVAHAALREVATLLDGRVPLAAAELEYIATRTNALEALARVLRQTPDSRGDRDRRNALLEARREVEDLTGSSSVAEAAALVAELSGRDAS